MHPHREALAAGCSDPPGHSGRLSPGASSAGRSDRPVRSGWRNRAGSSGGRSGLFGPFADEALKFYPGNTVDEAFRGNADAFRDIGFAWPSYSWVRLQAQTGKSKAYAAFLAQPSAISFSQDPRRRGVAHADDILYLNGTFLTQPDKFPTEAAVAEILQEYWVNFAKTGNPNGKGLPYWPSFDKDKPTTMQFSNGASLIMVPNRENLEFIERFYQWKRGETEKQRQK